MPHYYKAISIADLIHKMEHRLTEPFPPRSCYTDDALSLNNATFGDLIHSTYPKGLDIQYTYGTMKSASFRSLHLEIDGKGKKWPNYTTDAITSHSKSLNTLSSWQKLFSTLVWSFIRHTRACRNYVDFLYPNRLLTLGFWNNVILLYDWCHHYKSVMVVNTIS